MFRSDWEGIDRAVRFEADHLVGEYRPAFDGDKGPLLAGEGAGNEYLSRLSGRVSRLVADQRDPIIVAPSPGDGLRAARPEEEARLHHPFVRIVPADDNLVRTAVRWGEGHDPFSVFGGDKRSASDLDIVRFPLPVPATCLILDIGVLPLALVNDVLQWFCGEPLTVPIDGDQVDVHRVTGAADLPFCRQANIEIATVNDDRRTPRDSLAVVPADRGLDRECATP